VKRLLTLSTAVAALLAAASRPAFGQSMPMNMPGMKMPPHKAKAAAKKADHKKGLAKTTKATRKPPRIAHTATPEKAAGTMTMPMPMPAQSSPSAPMTMPMPSQPTPGATMTMPTNQQQAGGMGAMPMHGMGHGMKGMTMQAALGTYPQQRESSGTSWQPDASSAMGGPMTMSGDWMLMTHGVANLVYDHQSGPRGANKAFVSGMLMGMASRPVANGTLQLRAMLSPEPLMGPRGYPLLLQTGETANGRTPLIDRQHPHDLFMELSASVSQDIGKGASLFVYAGLPGEPAFGPPAFMHRESIMDSPEAPISHHWLDSTHVSFGVLTAGLVVGRVKLEVSRFNGREPDQHRWNIETGPLDSTSMRLSWNPTRTLALQGSWAHLTSPEQLEPGIEQKRLSASALWADDVAPGWHAAATLAWGRKTLEDHSDDAFAAETSLAHAGWTLFGRGEMVDNRELLGLQEHGPAFRVGKVSLGAVRDFPIAEHLSVGAGGLFAMNFVPGALAPQYGGRNPTGMMAFMRLKLH
jgi:hypothetical protein